jgi:septum formation topological specificity factor MinE
MDNDTLLEELKNRLKIIIANSYKDIKPELEKDLNSFLETSREKLERWILLFSTSALTEEELEWLLKSQLDLVALQALQTTGISKIRLNTLKNNILKTIFKVIIELVIPVI